VPVTPLVEVEDVTVQYEGLTVLEAVTLCVAPGDVLGLIGPNGAGKTTLLRVLLGLLTPARGAVRLFGRAPAALRDWGRLGYVPQRTTLDPGLPATVSEVVELGLVARRGWLRPIDAGARRRVGEALEQVGMAGQASARAGALSVGQQQRVLIARALVSDPELLVLDEPTGGVDPDAQESVYALLRRLNRERRVTVILVSHDVAVVAREVTRLACLNRRLVFHGTPADFLTDEALTVALYGPSVRVIVHHHG
jgi:zinc transport system ATP-binding protein